MGGASVSGMKPLILTLLFLPIGCTLGSFQSFIFQKVLKSYPAAVESIQQDYLLFLGLPCGEIDLCKLYEFPQCILLIHFIVVSQPSFYNCIYGSCVLHVAILEGMLYCALVCACECVH